MYIESKNAQQNLTYHRGAGPVQHDPTNGNAMHDKSKTGGGRGSTWPKSSGRQTAEQDANAKHDVEL